MSHFTSPREKGEPNWQRFFTYARTLEEEAVLIAVCIVMDEEWASVYAWLQLILCAVWHTHLGGGGCHEVLSLASVDPPLQMSSTLAVWPNVSLTTFGFSAVHRDLSQLMSLLNVRRASD